MNSTNSSIGRRYRPSLVLNWLKEYLIYTYEIQGKEVCPDARLREDLNIKSLDNLEVMMDTEIHYGIMLSDLEIEEVTTIQDLVDIVEQKIKD